MNQISISGRLTRDPQLRQTGNGKSVVNFTVAVTRPNFKDQTDFIDCVAWDTTAEFIANYFHKGKWIELSGVLTTRDFESKDGEKRKITELRADTVGFGGAKKEDADRSSSGAEAAAGDSDDAAPDFAPIPDAAPEDGFAAFAPVEDDGFPF